MAPALEDAIMFEFLGRNRAKESKVPEPTVHPVAEPTSEPPMSSNKQREMIRLALSGVLRRHGIPSQWLVCEVSPGPATSLTGVVGLILDKRWFDWSNKPKDLYK
jgi:hypothetical protein